MKYKYIISIYIQTISVNYSGAKGGSSLNTLQIDLFRTDTNPSTTIILQPETQGPSFTYQWAGSLHTRQGLATNWTGGQMHLPDHPQQSVHRNRGAHPAHEGAALEHIALVITGEYAAGTHIISPTKSHFSKAGKCNQPTKYTEMKTMNQVT